MYNLQNDHRMTYNMCVYMYSVYKAAVPKNIWAETESEGEDTVILMYR